MDNLSSFEVGGWIAGKYRIERVLGSGGTGVVVAARHSVLDELRAIKVLHRCHCEHRSYVNCFLRGAAAMARLESEHIVHVHATGRLDGGAPYIVMEHLEGTDLARVVRMRGPLPIGEAVLYALEVCEALVVAHARGVFHHDLKPSNLFVIARPDGSPCLKVLDFGSAKRVAREGSALLTDSFEKIGAAAYVAPEWAHAPENADGRADLWSLGVILFELLTGQLPFLGESMVDTALLARTAPPKPLSRLRPELPPDLVAVVLACLEKNPAQRIQTAVDLRAALAPHGPAGVSIPMRDPWLATTAELPAPDVRFLDTTWPSSASLRTIVRMIEGSAVRTAEPSASSRPHRPVSSPPPARLSAWTRLSTWTRSRFAKLRGVRQQERPRGRPEGSTHVHEHDAVGPGMSARRLPASGQLRDPEPHVDHPRVARDWRVETLRGGTPAVEVLPFAGAAAEVAMAPARSLDETLRLGAEEIARLLARPALPFAPEPPARRRDDMPRAPSLASAPSVSAAPPALVAPPAPAPAEPPAGIRARLLARIAAREPLLDLALAGADLHDLDLTGAELAGVDLTGADLGGCQLAGARLAGAKLGGADLTGADLTGADLGNADLARAVLDRATFDGAILTGAILTGARGAGASFVGATATRASFARGRWDEARFMRIDAATADFCASSLAGARFEGATLSAARFDEARGAGAVLDGARLAQARAVGADLTGASLRDANAPRSVWEKATLDHACFAGANLADANLRRARCTEASFAGAALGGANLQHVAGAGADLREARLEGADLRQAKLEGARFERAVLRNASAGRADLARCRFDRADLAGASLRGARLVGASFAHAKLEGTDFQDADLEGANVFGASRETAKLGAGARGLVEIDPGMAPAHPAGL